MEQKEIIQIIKDLRDCPKDSTSKWHVDICANKLIDKLETKQLILSGVVNCVYVVTERDNYGEQLFKGVFANKEKAIEYLAGDGLKEGNIDEINEIELD